MKELTPKQKLFVKEYLKDLNATQAALRAGYGKKNPTNVANIASELLGKTWVAAAIQAGMEKRAKKIEVSSDWVLERLMRIANIDLGQAYDENGHLLPVPQMPEEIRKCLTGVDVHKDFTEGVEVGETKKIKTLDQLRALEMIGRHLKLFNDDRALKLTVSWESLIMESLKEAK